MSHLRLRRCLPPCGLLVSASGDRLGPAVSRSPARSSSVDCSLPRAGGWGEVNVSVKAVFTAPAEGQPARLYVTAEIKKGWHIYSITQPKGGPIADPDQASGIRRLPCGGRLQGRPAARGSSLSRGVQGSARRGARGTGHLARADRIGRRVDPATLKIEGKLNVQACDAANCLPPHDYPFTAALGHCPADSRRKRILRASKPAAVGRLSASALAFADSRCI